MDKIPPGKIFLTGATGFVGFRILILALEAGFQVRCAVRSQSKADALLANPVLQNLLSKDQDSTSFVVLSDFSVEGAFNQALQDIKYVIHCASPEPGPTHMDWMREVVTPAVKITSEILNSSRKTQSVRRMVITSSAAGIIPYEILTYGDSKSDKMWTANDRIPVDQGPYENVVQAYNASKAAALEAIANFMEKYGETCGFDVINVLPGWVIGRNDLAIDPTGAVSWTNWSAMGNVFGHVSQRATVPAPGHLDDVARVHLLSLNPDVKGGQNFGVCLNADWSDTLEIVRKNFPEAVSKGIFPLNGQQPNVNVKFDASETEKALGIKFQSFESQVRSVAAHYLELLSIPGAIPVDPSKLSI